MNASWKGIAPAILAQAGVTEVGVLVRVPYRSPDGAEHNAKLFSEGRCWWEQAGKEMIPLGLELLPPEPFAHYCAVVIAEGESDTLAARQTLDGYEDHRGVRWYTLGCPGAGSWKKEWEQHAKPFPSLYVCGDGDEAGHRFSWTVRRDLPWARIVPIPAGEDLRSLLQHDPNVFPQLLDEADWMARFQVAVFHADTIEQLTQMLTDDQLLDTKLKEVS